jgi:Exocyst complex component Sec6
MRVASRMFNGMCHNLPSKGRAPLCRGFLNVSKVALDKAVDCIFEDKGTVDILKSLYRSKDWLSGVTTHSFLLTLEDYLSDLKEWLDAPFYKRTVAVRSTAFKISICQLLILWRGLMANSNVGLMIPRRLCHELGVSLQQLTQFHECAMLTCRFEFRRVACAHAGHASAAAPPRARPSPAATRAVQKCLHDMVAAFRAAFLAQMPANGLKPPEMERLDVDISDLRDFFGKYVALDKVDSGLEGLEAVQKLAQCESVDEFEETFGFMLMDEQCKARSVLCRALSRKRTSCAACPKQTCLAGKGTACHVHSRCCLGRDNGAQEACTSILKL